MTKIKHEGCPGCGGGIERPCECPSPVCGCGKPGAVIDGVGEAICKACLVDPDLVVSMYQRLHQVSRLPAIWRANADWLAECHKGEGECEAAGMQRVLSDQLEAAIKAYP
jgi:hypothetical protein